MSIVLVMLSNHLSLCCPLLLLSIFPSIRVFSNELALRIRWPKYWSFSCSLSNDYLGLISFRIDWFDFFAIHGILKRLLWHHSLKASVLWCWAFFMVQLSHLYMVVVKWLSRVWLFATSWTSSMGFSRQEYWSGLPFPSPGDLPDPGIEPGSPALGEDALTSESPGKPICTWLLEKP